MTTAEPETRAWPAPPVATPVPDPPVDASALALATALDSLIALGAATAPRSLQVAVGSSEVGHSCDRRIAYKLHRVQATNYRDPLRALVGTGFHLAMSEMFNRLNASTARWLVEVPVMFRGVPGTVDLYDRHTGTLVDWKTTTKDKVRRIRKDGPPKHYQTQVQLYAAGLKALGETPRRAALAYIPIDGELSDLWCWVTPIDERIAVDAIHRLNRLDDIAPRDAIAKPDRLCPWCSHFRPGSTDLAIGCPGNSERQVNGA